MQCARISLIVISVSLILPFTPHCAYPIMLTFSEDCTFSLSLSLSLSLSHHTHTHHTHTPHTHHTHTTHTHHTHTHTKAHLVQLRDTYTDSTGQRFERTQLPPFELLAVSKIEFATDRRSFATHLIPRSYTLHGDHELLRGYSKISRCAFCTAQSQRSCESARRIKYFAAISRELVRNFRAADSP